MPGGTVFSNLVTTTVKSVALGPQLTTQGYPTDPLFPNDPLSVIRELYPVDPVQPVGLTLQTVIGPDPTPTNYDLLL